jgi:DNA helicase-2/ATP-dependent DNA helicase PcrA
MTAFQPRPDQAKVLAYEGGKMGISAVPGSGKTRTLAELAGRLVREKIGDGQEVLVVTLVNSAVDNLKQRINASIGGYGLLLSYGYRVRTLHGLAHDIVRERPGLVGLSEDFGIIDEREAEAVREDAVEAWLRAHPDAADAYLDPDLEGKRVEWVKRGPWPSLVKSVAAAFIKRAKDLQLGPQVLLERLERWRDSLPEPVGQPSLHLARMGAEIYGEYQRSLAYRGVVDFDDLIQLALEALQRDPDYLARLRQRWPYILEDEAQDSSELQERILRLLVGEGGNWVRVGDPNQAIYDTFTNADPRFLRSYLKEDGVAEVILPESGRCQPAIIRLANELVDWTEQEHPTSAVRGAFKPQHIEPTGPLDPQPNPPNDPDAVKLVDRDHTPEAELRAVADSLARWLPEHPDWSVAALAPRNQRGVELIQHLRQRGIPCVELLSSTSVTRQTAGALAILLRCLADPTSARKLAKAFEVWRRDERGEAEAEDLTRAVASRIRGCPAVEAYLWPRADHDWLGATMGELPGAHLTLLTGFREAARRWHRAASLPIDQLLVTLAGELFAEPAELALAHKLAALLRDVATAHPGYRLAELVMELEVIARNERRFLGFTNVDTGFEPPEGEVTVSTMHKAKGLEWDRVYMLAVNNYNYPSGLAHDTYIAERWFVRDRLNLEAEALAQLRSLAELREADRDPGLEREGAATERARLEYVSERLRLFYVGITRARRDLIITWNTGRRRGERLQPSAPFAALHARWQEWLREEPPGDE